MAFATPDKTQRNGQNTRGQPNELGQELALERARTQFLLRLIARHAPAPLAEELSHSAPVSGRLRSGRELIRKTVIQMGISRFADALHHRWRKAMSRWQRAQIARTRTLEKSLRVQARPIHGMRHNLFVDLTNVARADLRTGIERVVRGISFSLLTNPPPEWSCSLVAGKSESGEYYYADRFTARMLDLPIEVDLELPVDIQPGDIFLGLDWTPNVLPHTRDWIARAKRRQAKIYFVIFDLLPVLRPDFFPKGMDIPVREWLQCVIQSADGVLCISRSVAEDLRGWLTSCGFVRREPLRVGFFHQGADLRSARASLGLPDQFTQLRSWLEQTPTFLMVGTVEPRKGHRLALGAMELLWTAGTPVNLLVVGKPGWNEDLNFWLRAAETQHSDRLKWFESASDELLDELYQRSRALLAASEAEGFGLPLVEAASHNLPVIARDIPVFREVGADYPSYFGCNDPTTLARFLTEWLPREHNCPDLSARPISWQQSCRQLLEVLLEDKWLYVWPS